MPLDYPIVERALPNGLRVVVSEDHAVPTVTVNIWVGVGSRHEAEGRTGFAHLFEHLMFQGSAHVASGEHFSALMAQGARLNATTWFDRTNYFETVPKGAFELALWMEADRHGRLLEAVTQENLDNQRDVVKEEKRQRYDNVPYGTALSDLYATVFPKGHPYHHPTIGAMEDLDAASLEDVHAFYRRHYRPDNTVLTVVGDVAAEEAFAAAERYFGGLPAAEVTSRGPVDALAPLTEPMRTERVVHVPHDRLYLGFRLPVDSTSEFWAASLALDCLGSMAISRLYRRLVRGDELATHVAAHGMGLVDGVSLGLVVVDVADGVSPDTAEQAVCAELERFAASGPTDVELEAARSQTERSWLSALAAQDERADLISRFGLLHGDPGFINTFLDHLADVSAAQVREAAARYLLPHARAVVAYLRAGTDEEDRVIEEAAQDDAVGGPEDGDAGGPQPSGGPEGVGGIATQDRAEGQNDNEGAAS
ncbi:MAG TPA: pitrilysin family protein [Segeticoccus sp.]|uniref:M16 family metallopeptidase n=1 Tax=Segeticoccus sp. TaxID=2706531 RepID=UPI002D7ED4A8|nr:pitrilysin family protein [Segeticoccus sp.]HET8602208.1 pitrilysin family protein [Segeticoccus sp.]